LFLHSQEKEKDEPAQHLNLEAKIKEQIGAEVRLCPAKIMEEFNESLELEEKLTGISSGSNPKKDHLQGKASSTVSATHPVRDETVRMSRCSLPD